MKTLLDKLMICAAGAAEHFVNSIQAEREEVQAYENLRAAVRDVEAQRNFLKQQGQWPERSC